MKSSFQERIQYAIKVMGGNQSELARQVNKITGGRVTAQAIQKLAHGNPPATSSGLTVAIAQAAGLNPYWLALGKGEPHGPPQDLIERTMLRIQTGEVPDDLKNSLYSLMSAIAGPANSAPTPHAATNVTPYQVKRHPPKEATG